MSELFGDVPKLAPISDEERARLNAMLADRTALGVTELRERGFHAAAEAKLKRSLWH